MQYNVHHSSVLTTVPTAINLRNILSRTQPTNPSGASFGIYPEFKEQNVQMLTDSQLSPSLHFDVTNPAALKSRSASAEVLYTLMMRRATIPSKGNILSLSFHHDTRSFPRPLGGSWYFKYVVVSRSTRSAVVSYTLG